MLLPKVCICIATIFEKNENHVQALEISFNQANKETPPSSCLEKTITSIALGAFFGGCVGSHVAYADSHCSLASKAMPIAFSPFCLPFVFPDQSIQEREESTCSSGLSRDYTVVKKTLATYPGILVKLSSERT